MDTGGKEPLPPFPPVSILAVLIIYIWSGEVLLFLVLLFYINTHNRMKIHIRGSLNKFPDLFRMGTFIDSKLMKL